MSDTYNPNEIVKCKHLNELARQLKIKLDGGTDPKPQRQTPYYRYRAKNSSGSNSWFNVPTNGIINLTTETVYGNQLSIMIQTDIDSANMQILNLTDSNTEAPILLRSVSYEGDGNNDTLVRDKWRVIFNKAATATINDAHQVEFDIVFAETAQYAEWKRHITFNITLP